MMLDLPFCLENPTDSVNLNVMHTRKGATRTEDTVLGHEAVRIQVSGEPLQKGVSLESSAWL